MDDWIIFGLKSENDVIYQVVKQLKECISQQKPASIEKIYIQNISEIHKPIRILKQVFRKLHPLEKNQDKRFTTQQLKLIIHEIKSIQDNSQKISGFTFYQLFQRRKNFPDCQNFIPDCIQQLSDDKIKLLIFRMGAIQRGETLQNFQNTDFLNSQKEFSSKFASLQKSQADILMETLNNENQSFSPKILLTALVLLDSSLPTSTDIEEYQNLFANFCQSCSAKDTLIYHEDFIQIPAWFDQSEDDSNNYEGYQINRTKFIKSLLFDVYRQPQENYIDYRVYIKQLKKFSDIEFGSYWNLLFGEI
ncbi:hypothetical protein PPERSA_05641 [Pseudocohnilembus persalinus]|uniref:Uncharacterized protein n=1 Tax=Pseudocohnilembus persalinus TaxID=266149 RepID=A0A0V0QQ99_PSEPJ|nr:hypothetical protein PPERSA_05641 [Pseudocohnilembus persalinus]|eukprot:KRX04380.1 hypothetical protein PPERSA_05641 [Pseudocohnilembus persalinus]